MKNMDNPDFDCLAEFQALILYIPKDLAKLIFNYLLQINDGWYDRIPILLIGSPDGIIHGVVQEYHRHHNPTIVSSSVLYINNKKQGMKQIYDYGDIIEKISYLDDEEDGHIYYYYYENGKEIYEYKNGHLVNVTEIYDEEDGERIYYYYYYEDGEEIHEYKNGNLVNIKEVYYEN
jgi:antitoxin component YwqK of YwqJK toxin-antitoxin module